MRITYQVIMESVRRVSLGEVLEPLLEGETLEPLPEGEEVCIGRNPFFTNSFGQLSSVLWIRITLIQIGIRIRLVTLMWIRILIFIRCDPVRIRFQILVAK